MLDEEPGWVQAMRGQHQPWTTGTATSHTLCLLDGQPWPCQVVMVIDHVWGNDHEGMTLAGEPCITRRLDELAAQRDTLERVLRAVRGYTRQWRADAAQLRAGAALDSSMANDESARRKVREAAGLERAIDDADKALALGPPEADPFAEPGADLT